jgi:methionine synthase II (cobalamin-independent)
MKSLPLFPTQVIGSLPRTQSVRALLFAGMEGRMKRGEYPKDRGIGVGSVDVRLANVAKPADIVKLVDGVLNVAGGGAWAG